MVLLFLESLGTTELLVILVVALVLFGPRRLPEMTRKFGKSLNDFKRASDDFKRTWEREVALENVEREAAIDRAMVAETEPVQVPAGELGGGTAQADDARPPRDITEAAVAPVQGTNIARGGAPAEISTPPVADEVFVPEAEQPARKTDWL